MLPRVASRGRRRFASAKSRRSRRPDLEALECRQLLASGTGFPHVHLNIHVAKSAEHARQTQLASGASTAGTHLYIASTIPTAPAGASLGSITVEVLDAKGTIAKNDTTTVVELYMAANAGGAQLLSAATETAINTPLETTVHDGVATFTGVAINKAAIGYTLGVAPVNNPALLPATSNSFVINADAPKNLAFLVQPAYTDFNGNASGVPFVINNYNSNSSTGTSWPGVVVGEVDQFGNWVTSGVTGGMVSITAAPVGGKSNPNFFSSSATTQASINPSTGVADFTNLQWLTSPGMPVLNAYRAGDSTLTILNATSIANSMKQGPVVLAGPGIPVGDTVKSADTTKNTITLTQPIIPPATPSGVANYPPTTIYYNNAGSFTLTASLAGTSMKAASNDFTVSVATRTAVQYVPGFAMPVTMQVGAALPVIKIAVTNQFGETASDDNTDVVVLQGGGLSGTLSEPVVNGVATFDDLAVGNQQAPNPTTVNFSLKSLGVTTIAQSVAVEPGSPYQLAILNPDVPDSVAGQAIQGTAKGIPLSPIQVAVEDAAGNPVTSDNQTIVSIGVLPAGGRDAIFVGQNTGGLAPLTGFQVTGTVQKGLVSFPGLFITSAVPGVPPIAPYQLAVSTTDFNAVGSDTNPFKLTNPGDPAGPVAAVKKSTKAKVKSRGVAKTGDTPNPTPTSTGIVNYGLASLTTNFDTIKKLKAYQNLPAGKPGATPPSDGSGSPEYPNVAPGFKKQKLVPQSDKFWSSLMFRRTTVPPNPDGSPDKRTPQDSQGREIYPLYAEPLTGMVNSNVTVQLKGSTTKGTDVISVPANQGKLKEGVEQLSLGMTVTGGGLPANTTITSIDSKNNKITVSTDKVPKSQNDAPLTFTDFAGLGIAQLSSSAMFVTPSVQNLDLPYPYEPQGQPLAWTNPQAPGAQSWEYNYSGDGNSRQYQDFAVGLTGVHADGKVQSYSDSTVTIDWQGPNAQGKNEQLLATLGEGLPFAYFTVPTATQANPTRIQLATTPKSTSDNTQTNVPSNVTVTSYAVDSSGKATPAPSGTGPFELEIRYAVHDSLDDIKTTASTTKGSNEINLAGASAFVGMPILSTEFLAGSVITGFDPTNPSTAFVSTQALDTNPAATVTIVTPAVRTFDNFYGVYLPSGTAWSVGTKDAYGDTTITATVGARNYFSVATLPGGTQGQFNTEFNTFLPHAYTFVTGSTSSFSYNQQASTVTTTYSLETKSMQQPASAGADTSPLQALSATQYNNLTPAEMSTLKRFGEFSYASPHGTMLLWDGAQFQTQLTYTGVLPSVPPLPNGGAQLVIPGSNGLVDLNTGDAALWHEYLLPILRSVSTISQSDGELVLDKIFPTGQNNYVEAQSMYGAAQLVPILLEISQSTDARLSTGDKAEAARYAELVYNAVKNEMDTWLMASGNDTLQVLYYQPKKPQESGVPPGSIGWQSLMGVLGFTDADESLNDHQLIAGYFIKVAAFLDQYDSTWGQTTLPVGTGKNGYLQGKMGDIVNLMIGDVANADRASNMFPYMRNFDVWAGHSWADGGANDDNGENLESSSEAMNFDSAVIQWGQVTGDQSMLNLGVYLYTTELQSVQSNWYSIDNQTIVPFSTPSNPAYSDVIPPQYLGSASDGTQRTLVTKVTGSGGSYIGFIGFPTSSVAGIQMIPLSGSAYYLGQDPSFVTTNYNLAQKGNTAPGRIPVGLPTYQGLLLPYLALSDPTHALTLYENAAAQNQITPVNPNDLIDNNAFNMHWIEALAAYGHVDATITANTPSYTVFTSATSVHTFVASNVSAVPETVTFTQQSTTGAPQTLLTETVPAFTTLVTQGSGSSPRVVAEQTTPNYAPATPANRVYFTADNKGQPTLTYGAMGTGAKSITWDGSNDLKFTISGVTGTLSSQNAIADFSMWLDPGTRVDGSGTPLTGAPTLTATITYALGPGTGPLKPLTVSQTFSLFALSQNAGFVEYRSQYAGGLSGQIPPTPTQIVDGSVTITIEAKKYITSTWPVRFRINAAPQQGEISYLDLPFNLTTAGVDSKNKPIPVSSLNLGGQTLGGPLPDISGP
jgi:hypothetical protein